MSNSLKASKTQNTVVSYKLQSPTHIDEITIVNHRHWNHLGVLVIDRTIKRIKKQRRILPKPNSSPDLTLVNVS